MKKIILFLLIILPFTSFSQIPNNVKIEEKIVSIGTCFTANDNIKINQNIVMPIPTFIMYQNGKRIASAREAIFTVANKIIVYDASGYVIGTIQEQLFTNWGFYSKYKIYDKNKNLLATSEKHKYLATKFNIKNNQGETICTIKRPIFNPLFDTWYVTFNSPNVDKRILLFIPCFKTYYDNHHKK